MFFTLPRCHLIVNWRNYPRSSFDQNPSKRVQCIAISWLLWFRNCFLRLNGVRTKFSWGGGSFSGIWWLFVCGVRFLWRHNLTSCSFFQTNDLKKFVDIICIFLYTHSAYFMCHCTEYKLSALQVRISEENKPNASSQEFITAKIWLRVVCLVEYEQSSIGVRLDWLAHTPVCKIESH